MGLFGEKNCLFPFLFFFYVFGERLGFSFNTLASSEFCPWKIFSNTDFYEERQWWYTYFDSKLEKKNSRDYVITSGVSIPGRCVAFLEKWRT